MGWMDSIGSTLFDVGQRVASRNGPNEGMVWQAIGDQVNRKKAQNQAVVNQLIPLLAQMSPSQTTRTETTVPEAAATRPGLAGVTLPQPRMQETTQANPAYDQLLGQMGRSNKGGFAGITGAGYGDELEGTIRAISQAQEQMRGRGREDEFGDLERKYQLQAQYGIGSAGDDNERLSPYESERQRLQARGEAGVLNQQRPEANRRVPYSEAERSAAAEQGYERGKIDYTGNERWGRYDEKGNFTPLTPTEQMNFRQNALDLYKTGLPVQRSGPTVPQGPQGPQDESQAGDIGGDLSQQAEAQFAADLEELDKQYGGQAPFEAQLELRNRMKAGIGQRGF